MNNYPKDATGTSGTGSTTESTTVAPADGQDASQTSGR